MLGASSSPPPYPQHHSVSRSPSPAKKRPPRTSHPKKWRASNAGNDNVSKGSFGIHPASSFKQQQLQNSSSNDSVATPSSVHVMLKQSAGEVVSAIPLTRDLSDLSGSYMNGNTAVRSSNATATHQPLVYSSDASGNSYHRPWRHAQILSPRLPLHPQPHADDESSVGNGFQRRARHLQEQTSFDKKSQQQSQKLDDISVIEKVGEGFEVGMFMTNGSSTSTAPLLRKHQHQLLSSLDGTSKNHSPSKLAAQQLVNKRNPIVLILMDPQRKKYELMQLWIDAASDTVRDVLQAVTRNLTDSGSSWRQDYDGLFQVRNNHFSQLIHVLPAGKYDVVPAEVWVAKPWAMSAKATVGYASTLLNHLKQIGVLQYARASDFDSSKWKQLLLGRGARQNAEDTVLVLSKMAQKRVYVPEGIILKHHHACQFLCFTPSFEVGDGELVRVDVLSGAAAAAVTSGAESSDAASALSDSHCGSSELMMLDEEAAAILHQHQPQEHETFLLLPESSQIAGAGEEDVKSQAESTYSTSGSGSPTPRGRLQVGGVESDDAASLVTRESSYMLKRHNGPLPHYLPSTQQRRYHHESSSHSSHRGGNGGSIGRLFAVLNCRGNSRNHKQRHHHHQQQQPNHPQKKDHVANYMARSNSRLTNVTYPATRRSFEDNDLQSQCSGAPLLFTQNDTAAWTTTV